MASTTLRAVVAIAIAFTLAACSQLFGPSFYETIPHKIEEADIGVTRTLVGGATDIDRRCEGIGVTIRMEEPTVTARQLDTVLAIIQPEIAGIRECYIAVNAETVDLEPISLAPAAAELGLASEWLAPAHGGLVFSRDALDSVYGGEK